MYIHSYVFYLPLVAGRQVSDEKNILHPPGKAGE